MQSKSLPPLTSFLVGQPYITAAPSCLLLSVCLLRSSLQSPDSDYSAMLKISTWPWKACVMRFLPVLPDSTRVVVV